jgi:hypothetical protein
MGIGKVVEKNTKFGCGCGATQSFGIKFAILKSGIIYSLHHSICLPETAWESR